MNKFFIIKEKKVDWSVFGLTIPSIFLICGVILVLIGGLLNSVGIVLSSFLVLVPMIASSIIAHNGMNKSRNCSIKYPAPNITLTFEKKEIELDWDFIFSLISIISLVICFLFLIIVELIFNLPKEHIFTSIAMFGFIGFVVFGAISFFVENMYGEIILPTPKIIYKIIDENTTPEMIKIIKIKHSKKQKRQVGENMIKFIEQLQKIQNKYN